MRTPKILFWLNSGYAVVIYGNYFYMIHKSKRLREWTERKTLGEVLGLPKVISFLVDSYLNDTKLSLLYRVPQKKYSVMDWEPEISTINEMISALHSTESSGTMTRSFMLKCYCKKHLLLWKLPCLRKTFQTIIKFLLVWKRQFHQKKNQRKQRFLHYPSWVL